MKESSSVHLTGENTDSGEIVLSSPVGFIYLVIFSPSVLGYTELQEGEGLSVNTDMSTIVKTMAAPESGLDVRDRMWLKITIPNAFIGELRM